MKLYLPIAWLGLVLLAVPAATSIARAAETDPSVLRVGVSANSAPMVFKEAGQVAGIEADLAVALGKELGKKVVFVEEEREKLIDGLCAGKFDIIMSSMSVTLARRHRIAFANPYLKIGQMALTRGGESYSYLLNLASQAKNGVGVKPGTTADFLVRQEFPKLKRKYYDTGEDGAKALLKKKIDLFISDAPMIWHLAGLYESQGLSVMPTVLSEEDLAWGIRRADTALLDSVNAFLKKAQQSGELNRTFSKWMPGFR